MSIMIPPLFYGIYAIAKYQIKTVRMVPTMGLSILAIMGLTKLGLMSSNHDMNVYYK